MAPKSRKSAGKAGTKTPKTFVPRGPSQANPVKDTRHVERLQGYVVGNVTGKNTSHVKAAFDMFTSPRLRALASLYTYYRIRRATFSIAPSTTETSAETGLVHYGLFGDAEDALLWNASSDFYTARITIQSCTPCVSSLSSRPCSLTAPQWMLQGRTNGIFVCDPAVTSVDARQSRGLYIAAFTEKVATSTEDSVRAVIMLDAEIEFWGPVNTLGS